MSRAEWTEEEKRLAMAYGVCKICGAPREARLTRDGDANSSYGIICTKDATHAAFGEAGGRQP